MIFIFFKGSTAFECQVWRVWFRWVHLTGEYWRRKPWRRFSAGWDSSANNGKNVK